VTFEQGREPSGAGQATGARADASRDARALLDVALAAARAGAEVVRSRAGDVRTLRWDEKTPVDFVSEVDTSAEERIRSVLHAREPGSRVIGEELSPTHADDPALTAADGTRLGVLPASGVAFVVDPLDGTTNFLHGYPEYAVSIGAALDGRLVAGVVVNAATGETFTASLGGGAFRDGQPVHVSPIVAPARALVGTGYPFKHPEQIPVYLAQFDRVIRATSGVRRAGAAALDLCDVACGRFEAFWELSLAPWDVAAGILLVREAGGIVTDLEGHDAVPRFGGLVAGNAAMHRWMMLQL
jgi:myo-inositol-1(or 4)-monophosphatase